ncbi:MAG: LysR family transcriptional regulator [Pseudomonadota bacterium]
MQQSKWDDLRFVLAIQRGKNLAAAARRLGVNKTTVSRRLDALGALLGQPIYERLSDGTLRLTTIGEGVAHQASLVEHHIGLIEQKLTTDHDPFSGRVRITATPIVANRILLPRLDPFLTEYPSLRIDLVPEGRNLSLTDREADLALRLERPKFGGAKIKARRIADIAYAPFARRDKAHEDPGTLPWIAYDTSMAHLLQARWVVKAARDRGESLSPLRVADGEAALEAVRMGLGKSYLPILVAQATEELESLEPPEPEKIRELWLLAHETQLRLSHVRVTADWLNRLFGTLSAGM